MAKKNPTPPTESPKNESVTEDQAPTVETTEAPAVEPQASEAPTESAEEISAPRRRGRPKGSRNATNSAPVSPSEAANAVTGSPAKKGRGRPPKKSAPLDTGELAKQVQGLHHLAALATGIPEFVLQPQEAEMLAQGISAVCDEYGLSLSGKTGAAVQLLAAAAMVYAPRVAIIGARIKQNREAANMKRAAEAAGTVVDGAGAHAPFTVVGGSDASPAHS